MVVGCSNIGKSLLIMCLVRNLSMRDVLDRTILIDEQQTKIRFPRENIELKIRFLDVAGEFAAQDMIA